MWWLIIENQPARPQQRPSDEVLDRRHGMAALQLATGADGFNGDTMGYVPKSFWDAAVAVALGGARPPPPLLTRP